MIFDLIEIAWKSLVASALTLALLMLLKRRSAAERSWVAHAGMIATLLLPLGMYALPQLTLSAPAALTTALISSAASNAASAASGLLWDDAVRSVSPAELAAPAEAAGLLLWIYLIPALLSVLATLVAVFRLFALRARSTVIVEQDWLNALAHAQRRMGLKHGTALLVSEEVTSPVSWGVVRPVIVLNAGALDATDDAEAIIAHELAHVVRLDWLKLLLSRIVTALFWFNPLVWILARQCHQLREEAADDAVLSSDIGHTEYAALLLSAARHQGRRSMLAAHGVAIGRELLKRRLSRILDSSSARGPARLTWAATCSVLAVLVSAPLSALTPVSALGESPSFPSVIEARAAHPRSSTAARLDLSDGSQMHFRGVTPAYVNSIAAIGPEYARLTPDELVALWNHDVDDHFVRGMRSSVTAIWTSRPWCRWHHTI